MLLMMLPDENVPPHLLEMASSPDRDERLEALSLMGHEIESLSAGYLKLARTLIADADNDCRWQALIFVGDFVKSDPEAIWDVVCEFGISPDEDMRTGVATVLLEHLLEHHFDLYVPKLRERLETRSPLLADTLRRCWPHGQASARWQAVEELVAEFCK